MPMWTRRRFLRIAAMGGAAFGLLGIEPIRGFIYADTATYKGASYLPPAYKELRFGTLGFVERLQKKAPDRVEFYDSASLMKADEQVRGLRVRSIQFMVHTSTYITQEFPILGVIELPGICEQLFQHGELLAMESPLWKLINDELVRDNLFMLSCGGGVIEPEYVWSGNKKVLSLADLQGKRCRVVSPWATQFLKGLGAGSVRIPSEEIFFSLQRGAVDGVVANVNTVCARNLYQRLHFCFQAPITTATIAIFMLKDVWDKMPGQDKAAFWEAGKWYDENQCKIGFKKLTQEAVWPVIKGSGMLIIEPSASETAIMRKKAGPVWASWRNRVGEALGQRAIDLATGNA